MPKNSDQVVQERRLKPIYDALDAGNNKKAAQEAEKVLRKHPAMHCAKALKALALIRAERVSEAELFISEVEKSDKSEYDENTLQALCHCFKESYMPERISLLYERMCTHFPRNEEHLTQLFMSYVRVRNYKQQQRVAVTLYKEFQRNPYYFWNVMSIVMQAMTGDYDLAQRTLYPLAEKMVSKIIDSNLIQAEAECDLYAMILEQSCQYAKAAHFFEDNMARHLVKHRAQFLFYRVLHLYQKDGSHDLVIERSINDLRNNCDDWTMWTYLFDSVFSKMNAVLENDEREKLLDKIAEFIHSCVEITKSQKDGPLRGPFLARLCFIRKLLDNGIISRDQLGLHGIGDPFTHLLEYVLVFYSKPCCFVDLKVYLTLLTEEQAELFLQRMSEFANEQKENSDTVKIETISAGWAEILYQRLRFALGKTDFLSLTEKRLMIAEMSKKALRCHDSGLAAAAYLHIAVYILWNLYSTSSDISYLYQVILLAEGLRKQHPTEPVSALLLCKVYSVIGAVSIVQDLLQTMEVKYIQRDTLGHFIFGLLEQYGRFGDAIIYYTELTAFYDQSEKEAAECLTTAYKNGSFLQVPQLVNFIERLNRSLIAVGADVQTRLLSSCFAVDSPQHIFATLYGDEEPIDFSAIEDSRDLTVIPSLEVNNRHQDLDNVKQSSYYEQIDAMKLKDLLMKSVALIAPPNGSFVRLSSYISVLEEHVEHCRLTYNAEESLLIQAPPSLHLNEMISTPKFELLLSLLNGAADTLRAIETARNGTVPIDENEVLKYLPESTDIEKTSNALVAAASKTRPETVHLVIRHCSSVLQTLAVALLILKALELALCDALSSAVRQKTRKGSHKVVVSDRYYVTRNLRICTAYS